MNKNSHINNKDRPLIFVGSNSVMYKLTDLCDRLGIYVAGILDKDYYGNTDTVCDLPVIDTEENIQNYTDYNFFCATNWLPMTDAISTRNRDKRKYLIQLFKDNNIKSISLVDPMASVSKSAVIGHNVFIDAFTLIESNVVVGDFTSIYAQCAIGHNTVFMENCVMQRCVGTAADQVYENDVFFGGGVRALKTGAKYSAGTFVHEQVYIARGTTPNEIVSFNGYNTKRVERPYTSDIIDN